MNLANRVAILTVAIVTVLIMFKADVYRQQDLMVQLLLLVPSVGFSIMVLVNGGKANG